MYYLIFSKYKNFKDSLTIDSKSIIKIQDFIFKSNRSYIKHIMFSFFKEIEYKSLTYSKKIDDYIEFVFIYYKNFVKYDQFKKLEFQLNIALKNPYYSDNVKHEIECFLKFSEFVIKKLCESNDDVYSLQIIFVEDILPID